MTSNKPYYLMSETVSALMFNNGQPNEEYFFYVDSCPLCNSKRLKKLFSQWGIAYFRCKECEFVFSNPRLTDKGAFRWYNSDYYNAAMQTEHYIAENYTKYYTISLNEYHFNKAIEIFENANVPLDVSIADLGCGSGAILHYLKDELGYGRLMGFDLNTGNIQFARRFRGIEIENSDIYDIDPETKFDVVISTENIEHVSHPRTYLQQIKKLMKSGGYLLLTTPHNDSTATTIMGLSGDHYCAPNHQNYFNFQNLSELLVSNGFVIKDYWIDKRNQFNLYAFLKRFLIQRDQVTAFPPTKVSQRTIWKCQKDRNKSIIINRDNNMQANNDNKRDFDNTLRISLKNKIKRMVVNLIPIKFKTHQIIIAKYTQ